MSHKWILCSGGRSWTWAQFRRWLLFAFNIYKISKESKKRSSGIFGNKIDFNVGELSWIKKFNLWQIDFEDQTDKLTNSIRIFSLWFFSSLENSIFPTMTCQKKERRKRQFQSQVNYFHLFISTWAISMLSLIEIWVCTHRWKLANDESRGKL